MDPISLYLERDILPEEKSEAKKYEEKLLDFGYPRIENYMSVLSLVLICFVYTPRHQNYSWRSYMKRFVGVTQEEIHISSSYYSRILVAGHAKGGAEICKEM